MTRPLVPGQAKPLFTRVALPGAVNTAHIHLKANREAAVVPINRVEIPEAAPAHRSDPAIGEVPPVQVHPAAAAVPVAAVPVAVVRAAGVPVAVVPAAAAHDLSTGSSQT